MERTRRWLRELWVYPWIGFALITASACNSSPASSGGREAGAGASNNAGAHIDMMCVGDRINNPPESFHYSYVYTDASGSVDKEADITAQDMAITSKTSLARIRTAARARTRRAGTGRCWTFQA